MPTFLSSLDGLVVAIAVMVVTMQVVAFAATCALGARMRRLFATGPIDIEPPLDASDILVAGAVSGRADGTSGVGIRFQLVPRTKQRAPARDLLKRTNRLADIPNDLEGQLRACTEVATACAEGCEGPAGILGSMPVYLGLAGTFGGVISGLAQLSVGAVLTEESIPPFLSGVLVAMICSLVGIALMVASNAVILPTARIKRDHLMADYLANLRRALVEKVGYAIEAAGGARPAFAQAFDDLAYAMLGFKESLGPQREMLESLRNLNLSAVIKRNVELLDKTKDVTERFGEFSQAVGTMTKALNGSAQVVSSVNELMGRITTFETNLNQLGDRLAADNTGVGKTIKWLDESLDTLKNRTQAVQQVLDQSEHYIIREFASGLQAQFEGLESRASQTFDHLVDQFANAIKEGVDPDRVKNLLHHVEALPDILKALKAGDHTVLSALEESARQDRELREQLLETMKAMAQSSERIAASVSRLERGRSWTIFPWWGRGDNGADSERVSVPRRTPRPVDKSTGRAE